ncbi:flagellar protein [Halalkalibacter oceani]|uniref:Flagellar protein FliT n=1 Tax=Halalkalibacter oceani TaxID=1653776 RepID=A0A9X2DQP3_9BACI|nr:flagellar protein [Halalkalibacter oceani]MCM3714647.1 flagellar protein [Halalkalibacter oceani]
MSVIKTLYLQTEALFSFVNDPFPKKDEEREAFLAELDQRLDEREKLIAQVDRSSLNEAEQKLGAELIKLNKRLMNRLEQLKQEIRMNLTELQTKKATNRKYENPYEGPGSDGIFFDKRGV